MNDQRKSENQDPDSQAPKFMRPKRPVMDEPLDDGEMNEQVDQDAPEAGPVKEPAQEEPNLESTRELKPEPEPPAQAEQKADEAQATEAAVHSPYFPRGVYEDARSVEAYYGRGDAEDAAVSSPEKGANPADSPRRNRTRWLVLIFAILLILAILFLTFVGRTPTGIF